LKFPPLILINKIMLPSREGPLRPRSEARRGVMVILPNIKTRLITLIQGGLLFYAHCEKHLF